MAIFGATPKMAFTTVSAILSVFLFFKLLATHSEYSPNLSNFRSSNKKQSAASAARDDAIRNKTLGFEKIFTLNLPERSDKRDALALAASLTNISMDFIDGVKGQDVVNKALPYSQEDRHFTEPMLGSWRAHMNVIREVVEKGYSSALIFEDDVDWDIRIHEQLVPFGAATRAYQGYGDNKTEWHSPYGDDWDLLWVGHCHTTFNMDDGPTFTYPDNTTVPIDKLGVNPDQKKQQHQWPEHTRIVHSTKGPICTYAYAISLRGAQKLLWNLSVLHLEALFDNALGAFCLHKDSNAKCIGVLPSFFWPHEARGGTGKNSDNNPDQGGKTESRTKNLQRPTRMNIEKLVRGEIDQIVDQYPEPAAPAKTPPKDETKNKKESEKSKGGRRVKRTF